jgi:hypothetical protein
VPNEYHLGQAVKFKGDFKNEAGALADPGTITLRVRNPEGTITTYTYAAAEITKDAVGQYSKVVALDKEGTWKYRFEGTGAVQAADEDECLVLESVFYAP